MPSPGVGYKVGLDTPLRDYEAADPDRSPDAGRTTLIRDRVRADLAAVTPTVLDAQVCSWTDSPDGKFVFGGSPGFYDMVVGVKNDAAGTVENFQGMYYQAGIDQDTSQLLSANFSNLDTYYGMFSVGGGSLLGTQRVQSLFSNNAVTSTFSDTYPATIMGINGPAPISVVGGQYSINGGSWIASPGVVNNFDLIEARLHSGAPGSSTTTTVTVGGCHVPSRSSCLNPAFLRCVTAASSALRSE